MSLSVTYGYGLIFGEVLDVGSVPTLGLLLVVVPTLESGEFETPFSELDTLHFSELEILS